MRHGDVMEEGAKTIPISCDGSIEKMPHGKELEESRNGRFNRYRLRSGICENGSMRWGGPAPRGAMQRRTFSERENGMGGEGDLALRARCGE